MIPDRRLCGNSLSGTRIGRWQSPPPHHAPTEAGRPRGIAFAVVDVFLRINGHTISADSTSIYRRMIELIATRTFDMEHLAPWLEKIVRPRE